ncbi:mitochondrial metalloendopeptidase OMA1-like [Bidens hawaiensis]|uniref:mitochondrial metalloendopeptidase OMA1-like n=1 Tax=Bidens hawaiensis TaxID=980011 RepID=UPI00404B4FEC
MASWYRRSKLGFDAIARYITAPKPPIHSTQLSKFTSGRSNYPIRVSKIVNPSSNSRSIGHGYRHYYVDSRQVRHFKPRGFKRWTDNPRNVLIVVLVGSGVGLTMYFGNVETIPYTKRRHLVLMSHSLERMMGESQFQNMKAGFKGKILPVMHPESIRVKMIANEIIGALQRGLKKEQVWTDLSYGSESGAASEIRGKEAVMAMAEETGVGDRWYGKDELIDDAWVEESRKKGKDKGVKSGVSHLEGLKWEVLVVNDRVVNAFCLPGGKIVVFTGLLEHFKTDEEIATIIGHEVAHAVARHAAEQITKNLWFTIGQLILYQFVMPDLVNTMSNLLLKLPFSRRMEIEADYIGLLLMASAGYDPRVAPKVFEKLGQVSGDSALRDYLSTHPSGKKRSKLLSEASVMQEAISIYREAIAGREVDGFFL